MGATRNADANLIMKARNEADRAIESVTYALQGLHGEAEHADSGVAKLGKTLAAERSAADLHGEAGRSRQQVARIVGWRDA